jgi:hypothetical protein
VFHDITDGIASSTHCALLLPLQHIWQASTKGNTAQGRITTYNLCCISALCCGHLQQQSPPLEVTTPALPKKHVAALHTAVTVQQTWTAVFHLMMVQDFQVGQPMQQFQPVGWLLAARIVLQTTFRHTWGWLACCCICFGLVLKLGYTGFDSKPLACTQSSNTAGMQVTRDAGAVPQSQPTQLSAGADRQQHLQHLLKAISQQHLLEAIELPRG